MGARWAATWAFVGVVLIVPVARAQSDEPAARKAEPAGSAPAASTPGGAELDVGVEGVDLTGAAPPRPAEEDDEAEESWLDRTPTRREGFTVGVLVGSLLGNVSGFPNDALRIGRDEFRTTTGFAGGGFGSVFIGVTFADWIGFSLAGGYGAMLSADHDTRNFAIDFRVDGWPFFGLGGVGEDLGVNVTAGLGGSNTTRRDGATVDEFETVIDGALASHLGLGVFWEGVRLWKINMGPFVGFDAYFSQSVLQTAATIGWRTVLYAGPSASEDGGAEP